MKTGTYGEDVGTRADCVRDVRQFRLPGCELFGYSRPVARPGCWIVYEIENHKHVARVVGGVTCEGIRYLEVLALAEGMTAAYVRWIDPATVRQCYPSPPRDVLAFMAGEWTDAGAVLRRARDGFAHPEWQAESSARIGAEIDRRDARQTRKG